MIVEERMRTYINSLDMGNTPFLEELEKEALAGRVPIIRKEMQSFLKMFLAATRPMKILEVGTAVGFSTLLMCEYGPENLKITTIENYEKRIPIARENFRKAGRESQIEFLTGDAGEILKELTGTYDLIFMDIQMPVMNGYEATAAIRSLPGAKGKLPIVAMTANAFAEDVQLAKNTGMNGHIAKPLDMNKLNDVLENWL